MNDLPPNAANSAGQTVVMPKSAAEALKPEAVAPPPRRSRASRSQIVVFLNFMMSLMILGVVAAGFAAWYGKKEFEGAGPLGAATVFEVKPNSGWDGVATQLERSGIISDSRIFQIGVRANGAARKLKAGEYELKAGASMREVMDTLVSGKSILYSLTIPEGWTVTQAFARISADPVLTGPMPTEMPAEGTLVADTQRFSRGMSRDAIITRMQADQARLVESIWAQRDSDLPVKDVNEFVTLASIVEKETGVADERPRVAAVFINRLRKGMRLQSDPTIIYGLFGGAGKPADRPIYRSDIDKPTPYNTYVIDGLPPTPIANPGKAALEAVANPARTDDLYFVADGTGGHAFASTLEEHNRNVERWREIEKQRGVAVDEPVEGEAQQ